MRTRAARGERALVERFPVVVDAETARRAAGGRRRLREDVTHLDVDLGGNRVRVELRKQPWRFGGVRTYLVCPVCGRDVMVLRRLDVPPYLGCKRDLLRLYAARYASQIVKRRAANLPAVGDEELAALVQETPPCT